MAYGTAPLYARTPTHTRATHPPHLPTPVIGGVASEMYWLIGEWRRCRAYRCQSIGGQAAVGWPRYTPYLFPHHLYHTILLHSFYSPSPSEEWRAGWRPAWPANHSCGQSLGDRWASRSDGSVAAVTYTTAPHRCTFRHTLLATTITTHTTHTPTPAIATTTTLPTAPATCHATCRYALPCVTCTCCRCTARPRTDAPRVTLRAHTTGLAARRAYRTCCNACRTPSRMLACARLYLPAHYRFFAHLPCTVLPPLLCHCLHIHAATPTFLLPCHLHLTLTLCIPTYIHHCHVPSSFSASSATPLTCHSFCLPAFLPAYHSATSPCYVARAFMPALCLFCLPLPACLLPACLHPAYHLLLPALPACLPPASHLPLGWCYCNRQLPFCCVPRSVGGGSLSF